MQMNFRRMFNDRKHHKRSKRGASNKVRDLWGIVIQESYFNGYPPLSAGGQGER